MELVRLCGRIVTKDLLYQFSNCQHTHTRWCSLLQKLSLSIVSRASALPSSFIPCATGKSALSYQLAISAICKASQRVRECCTSDMSTGRRYSSTFLAMRGRQVQAKKPYHYTHRHTPTLPNDVVPLSRNSLSDAVQQRRLPWDREIKSIIHPCCHAYHKRIHSTTDQTEAWWEKRNSKKSTTKRKRKPRGALSVRNPSG